MNSKKCNIFVFFCTILYFAPLIIAISGINYNDENNGKLSYNYYDKSCPNLQMMVKWGVWLASEKDARIAASLLRLHFHDCFVNGCEASVLLQDTKTFTGEQNAVPNKKSIRGFEVIESIKADVEKYCPSTVSCADILTLAAREAVLQSGGPYWDVLLGRLDGLTADQKSANEQLPSPLDSVENITAKFVTKRLDIQDMAILSGAHTIGYAQCSSFMYRLHNFNGSGKPDPTIAYSLLSTVQKKCSKVGKSNTTLVALDPQSTYEFDNTYYNNIMKNMGLLQSDQALLSDSKTGPMVREYSADPILFANDFASSMAKLGNIGVLTERGEIRNVCGFVN